jgi:hypothetical protein
MRLGRYAPERQGTLLLIDQSGALAFGNVAVASSEICNRSGSTWPIGSAHWT